jgi:hypothetical protein
MPMQGYLCVSLAALVGCHAAGLAPERESLPEIDGFVLKESFVSAAPRLLSCNPPKELPAPPNRVGRLCYASEALLLIFSGHDSLIQMQLTTLDYSYDTLHNAAMVWRRRAGRVREMMGRPPDSIVVKPIGAFSVRRWDDPRGAQAQVLRACWLGGPTKTWYGNVWLFDEMEGPDSARTRGIVEVFAGVDSRPGCTIGPRPESEGTS